MSCFGCNDGRNTCGLTMSSSCVWYTGNLPQFLIDENKLCKANINDIFKSYGEKLDYLLDQSKVQTLDKKGLGYDAVNITPLELFQVYNTEISNLKLQVADLTSQLVNINVGNLPVTIDLKCLAPLGVACETSPNTYTLQSILNIIFSQFCP